MPVRQSGVNYTWTPANLPMMVTITGTVCESIRKPDLRTDRQASVPEFTKRTTSMDGTLLITIFASVFCMKFISDNGAELFTAIALCAAETRI